ncbi:MAG: integrase core domain-containing protein [Verrucomicrobiales bacterium]|nr:integrase core domain-containing protein [Verrucomicrobiales bacterium]
MPWKTELPMELRQRFVSLAQSGHFTISELCEQFSISRKTGHKWVKRYRDFGRAGLADRSRSPRNSPGKTDVSIERLIVSERRKRPTWGAKKIRQILKTKYGVKQVPAVSTVGDILKRNGLVKARRRRGEAFHVKRGDLTPPSHNNHVWGVDFKGWFPLGNGSRCDPLTVSDLHSRYILRAQALPQATQYWTKRAFRSLFKQYGLPEIIRVDNGAPFATIGAGGLSKLSVWWIGLGIRVEYSRPGCPQDNGCHERMHRTMKAECCRPSSPNRNAQQQRFDRWRKDFNSERPHESLSLKFPAEIYQASTRRLDESIKIHLYDPATETRKVNMTGYISIKGNRHLVGEAFAGTKVSIEQTPESGLIRVQYGNVKLGIIENTPNARLRPTASAERWGDSACASPST